MKKILITLLSLIALAQLPSQACTNFLFTKTSTKDGSP